MPKLHQSITINANKQKVWYTITNKQKYELWTTVFNPGSTFEGQWEQGQKMKFLGPDEKGNVNSGLVSQIWELKIFEYISIKHLGLVKDGVEDFDSEEAKKWTPAFENYTLVEKDTETTEFVVDMDVVEDYFGEMEKMWQKGIVELKKIAEKPFEKITIKTIINQSLETVWNSYNNPEDVQKWNTADPSWHCHKAENDLKIGGKFSYTMAAKDGSYSFNFGGTYTAIENQRYLEYILDDGRKVEIKFDQTPNGVEIVEIYRKRW
jgi:uncharacterized protein YndB with AHSA1/START domain